MRMRAGNVDEVNRASGDWVFVDLGFARRTPSCGIVHGDGAAEAVTFATACERVVRETSRIAGPLNLLLEAPLSVAFTREGNPTGRSIEKRDGKTRYWHVGLGCVVLVAATYLVKAVASAGMKREVRLFEGFVSFKQRGVRSCHTDDVMCLRDVVWQPERFAGAVTPPDKLALAPSDIVSSAFAVAGLNLGVPPVITAAARRS